MADVRALLKAKRQEARITHPLALYNQAGQLRCRACGSLIKHASAWEGHLGSKTHRTNVARLKEEEKIREAQRLDEERKLQQQVTQGKRKAEAESDHDPSEDDSKRRRVDEPRPAAAFPTDFFSDSSRVPPPLSGDFGEEDDQTKPPPPPTVVDIEYERFQHELLNGDGLDRRETYERATVFAEPELALESHEGMPVDAVNDAELQHTQKISEEAARQHKEQEERELIMDRLLDEERAQEEADMKVSMLKARMEVLRKKREEGRALKARPAS